MHARGAWMMPSPARHAAWYASEAFTVTMLRIGNDEWPAPSGYSKVG
jgi:hypothetical protein